MAKQKSKRALAQRSYMLYLLNKYAIYIFIIFFGLLYSIISVTKYNHYQTGLDLAIYVQSMWFYTHFRLPYVTLYPTYGDLVWADHFSPSLILLTPLYFLWKDPRALLIFQSFFYVSGAYPVYRFSKEKIQSTVFALCLSISFLLFFGVQIPLTFDFHVGVMAASFVSWILWALFTKKWKAFIILCLIASGFKEDMPLYVAAFSLYLILTRKNWKLGSVLLILAIGFDYIVTKYLMPSFAHLAAKTFSVSYFNFRPSYIWSVFFDSPEKIRTMFLSFANVLFLPLLSGFFLLLPLAHFFVNFSNPEYPGRWGIELHYRGYLSPMLAFGTILSYAYLMKKWPNIFSLKKAKIFFACLLLVDALLFDFLLHLPLNVLLKPQFYYTESWIKDDNTVAKMIPANAYVLTVNNLAPQVAYREHIYYYPQNLDKAEYIFVDVRPNQPIINFWLTTNTTQHLIQGIQDLISSRKYVLAYRVHDALLLKRNTRIGSSSIVLAKRGKRMHPQSTPAKRFT